MSQTLEKTPENHRRNHLIDTRKAYVLDAARAVFESEGLEGASIREIAKKAGYTPGAIYSYFPSKEAIYAALLSESLERLKVAVMSAKPSTGTLQGFTLSAQARQLAGKTLAWFKFYYSNPRDLDLGFYLFQGMRPRGLTGDLNTFLNAQLIQALEPAEKALIEMGLPEDVALSENTATFAHGIGLLLLQHTGRIKLFKQNADELFTTYIVQLCQRYAPTQEQTSTTMAATNVEEEFLARQKPLW
jgi:AcrR family transcriptional regulator